MSLNTNRGTSLRAALSERSPGQPITHHRAAATEAGPVERIEVGLAAQADLDIGELPSVERRVEFFIELGAHANDVCTAPDL